MVSSCTGKGKMVVEFSRDVDDDTDDSQETTSPTRCVGLQGRSWESELGATLLLAVVESHVDAVSSLVVDMKPRPGVENKGRRPCDDVDETF